MIVFLLCFFVFLVVVFLYSRKFINPYKLYMVFGRKGSGKTTYMVKLAYRYHKQGRQIFSNSDIPFATVIDVSSLGQFVPPPESVLLIDEVGMIWDNRNFKNFRNDVRDYFKLQRHYRNIVYLFSQTFDIDIKLRNLTDAMYLVTSPIPILSIVRRIKRTIVLVQPVADAEGRIADNLQFVPWYMNLLGAKSLQFTFIPRWSKFFDSHDTPALPRWDQNVSFCPDHVDITYRGMIISFLKTLFHNNILLSCLFRKKPKWRKRG